MLNLFWHPAGRVDMLCRYLACEMLKRVQHDNMNKGISVHLINQISEMHFLSLEPFVPSGSNFEGSKQFFLELGFHINWDQGDYVGFQRDECRFILQKYDNVEFAQNFMLSVKVDNVEEFRQMVIDKQLPEKYGIRIGKINPMPYGREVNVIDIAGVCWHFVQQ